jgi:site-specific DNA recombinase
VTIGLDLCVRGGNMLLTMEATKPIKYCLYARKSSESDERQAMSIDSQIKEMMDLASREGLEVVKTLKESYSAKESGKRPVFMELIEDVRQGRYSGILTWAPDRMSRNAGDLGSLVDLMDGNKLHRIRTYSQTFSNTPNEKFLLMILCSQAKLENDNRGVNVKRGIRAKCEMGWRPGAAPIGYINRSFSGVKDIVLDPERAPIILEIFERSGLQHQSGRTIKTWLDSIGFATKGDYMLSLSQIYHILKNPFYAGYFEYPKGGPLYEGKHEAIITKELYELVRKRVTELVPEKPAWGSKQFPFKHLLYCGSCGSRLTAEEKIRTYYTGRTVRYVYYHCTQSTKDLDCPERSIKAANITSQILNLIEQGQLDDIVPTVKLGKRIEQHKRITNQLMKDRGLQLSERDHFKHYASYALNQGPIQEQDDLIRGLNMPLFVRNRTIFRRA